MRSVFFLAKTEDFLERFLSKIDKEEFEVHGLGNRDSAHIAPKAKSMLDGAYLFLYRTKPEPIQTYPEDEKDTSFDAAIDARKRGYKVEFMVEYRDKEFLIGVVTDKAFASLDFLIMNDNCEIFSPHEFSLDSLDLTRGKNLSDT